MTAAGTTRATDVGVDDIDTFRDFLTGVEPFTVFPERWLSLLAGLMTSRTFHEDEMIFRALDRSDAVYLVRRGEVTLFTDSIGEPVQLMARIRPGEMFGEVGVLERSRRTVSARAHCETEVLRLEADDLTRLGRASRRFGARLAQSALMSYMKESASKLELGRRNEVRICIDREILLRAAEREPIAVLLDNLSSSGACLRGVPQDWELETETRIVLALDAESELLDVTARGAWRKGNSVGLAFVSKKADHDARVEAALDLLLSDRSQAENCRVA